VARNSVRIRGQHGQTVMRIGVGLPYYPWATLGEQVDLAATADRLGFDSVWVSETWGQDVVAVLGLIAGRTERIRLGSALMQMPARQPTAAAMAAVTLNTLSGGRFALGLGLSGPQVSEGWYGVPFTAPLGRTGEYVDVVRAVLAGQPVDYRGGGTGAFRPTTPEWDWASRSSCSPTCRTVRYRSTSG
jgi:alkanesulfonate monooxygenase SsuD/methylene tetrahydromethanopterin reductase-like flavin-dependent oxidoreductase (luciferase family)